MTETAIELRVTEYAVTKAHGLSSTCEVGAFTMPNVPEAWAYSGIVETAHRTAHLALGSDISLPGTRYQFSVSEIAASSAVAPGAADPAALRAQAEAHVRRLMARTIRNSYVVKVYELKPENKLGLLSDPVFTLAPFGERSNAHTLGKLVSMELEDRAAHGRGTLLRDMRYEVAITEEPWTGEPEDVKPGWIILATDEVGRTQTFGVHDTYYDAVNYQASVATHLIGGMSTWRTSPYKLEVKPLLDV